MFGQFRWNLLDSGTAATVTFEGRLDETVKLKSLLEKLAAVKNVRLVLSGLTGMTSVGVREWHQFVGAIPKGCSVDLEECSPAFVTQLNTIKGFAGHGRVKSVYAPFFCDTCGHTGRLLIRVSPKSMPAIAFVKCSKCVSIMSFDEIAEDFFAFVNDLK
jgi:hypothetical protein